MRAQAVSRRRGTFSQASTGAALPQKSSDRKRRQTRKETAYELVSSIFPASKVGTDIKTSCRSKTKLRHDCFSVRPLESRFSLVPLIQILWWHTITVLAQFDFLRNVPAASIHAPLVILITQQAVSGRLRIFRSSFAGLQTFRMSGFAATPALPVVPKTTESSTT